MGKVAWRLTKTSPPPYASPCTLNLQAVNEPFPGYNIHLANEAYGIPPGWLESSLYRYVGVKNRKAIACRGPKLGQGGYYLELFILVGSRTPRGPCSLEILRPLRL